MGEPNERHLAVQLELSKLKRMRIIFEWWVEGRRYYVYRTRGGDATKVGSIECAEAFVLGCWSTLNGLRRRQGVS